MNSKNLIVTLSALLFSAIGTAQITNAVDVFHEDELPFDKAYEDWVQVYWRWLASAPPNPETKFDGLKEDGCFINRAGPVVMLLSPAVGGTYHQKCELSSNEGILIDAWSAECDGSTKAFKNKQFEELLECAKNYNLGRVSLDVYVDEKLIAQANVEDLKTINLVNVTEVSTQVMNITIPERSFLTVDTPGTYDGAVHGWFIFLKPLPVGEHTVRYINTVVPTNNAPSNQNNADITYSFTVK